MVNFAVQPCSRPYPVRLQPQTSPGSDCDTGHLPNHSYCTGNIQSNGLKRQITILHYENGELRLVNEGLESIAAVNVREPIELVSVLHAVLYTFSTAFIAIFRIKQFNQHFKLSSVYC